MKSATNTAPISPTASSRATLLTVLLTPNAVLASSLLTDADLQIAATALHYDLTLITGNLRHFERVPGLQVGRALADARRSGK